MEHLSPKWARLAEGVVSIAEFIVKTLHSQTAHEIVVMNYSILKTDPKRNVWDSSKESVVCLIEDKSGNCSPEV